MGTRALRVLVVDDHQMFAESLVRLLNDEPDIDVIGIAGTAEAAHALTKEHRPHVVVLDYGLPDLDGASVARVLRDAHHEVEIVMLTGRVDESVLEVAIQAGCRGFVTKDKAASELLGAVRAVGAGEAVIPGPMLANLVSTLRRDGRSADPELTAREREVLELLAQGLSTKAMADHLVVSPHTVRNHVQRVIAKLGAHSKLEAVMIAMRMGLVDRPG